MFLRGTWWLQLARAARDPSTGWPPAHPTCARAFVGAGRCDLLVELAHHASGAMVTRDVILWLQRAKLLKVFQNAVTLQKPDQAASTSAMACVLVFGTVRRAVERKPVCVSRSESKSTCASESDEVPPRPLA